MDDNQKKKIFYQRVQELCQEHGKAYGFDCPICGNYAIGMVTESGNAVIGSCATCKIAGRSPVRE